jgi:D-lyxose ketol-isomerase
LCGNRTVLLNNKDQIELNPCDVLYFDSGVYHHFWCDNEFSLVLNISFAPKNAEIEEIFNKVYPNRLKEIATKQEYIF